MNSAAPTLDKKGTGLGSQLIEAFSMQLEGEITAGFENDTYRLSLYFKLGLTSFGHSGGSPRQVVLTSAARAGSRH